MMMTVLFCISTTRTLVFPFNILAEFFPSFVFKSISPFQRVQQIRTTHGFCLPNPEHCNVKYEGFSFTSPSPSPTATLVMYECCLIPAPIFHFISPRLVHSSSSALRSASRSLVMCTKRERSSVGCGTRDMLNLIQRLFSDPIYTTI